MTIRTSLLTPVFAARSTNTEKWPAKPHAVTYLDVGWMGS